MDQQSLPLCRNTGAQGGNETQYLFSEGDIHPSDADVVRNPATGECVITRSSKLLRIILATDRHFLCFVFPLLSFSDVLLRDVYWLLGPTFSSPLAGASISNLESALPADLSGIAIELIADLTHRAADVLDEVSVPIVLVLPSSCSGGSDGPRAVVAKVVDAAVFVGTHGGEGPPSSNF